jgi:hypothetical protein
MARFRYFPDAKFIRRILAFEARKTEKIRLNFPLKLEVQNSRQKSEEKAFGSSKKSRWKNDQSAAHRG